MLVGNLRLSRGTKNLIKKAWYLTKLAESLFNDWKHRTIYMMFYQDCLSEIANLLFEFHFIDILPDDEKALD